MLDREIAPASGAAYRALITDLRPYLVDASGAVVANTEVDRSGPITMSSSTGHTIAYPVTFSSCAGGPIAAGTYRVVVVWPFERWEPIAYGAELSDVGSVTIPAS